ncbi:MAG: YqaJ viral recombinase family protein [Desulfobacterales bacterium]|nr:MAG: YqaJ viral recombinase family protein [Desulfobacterales bacterium]
MGKFTASEIYKLMGTPKKKGELLTETAKSFVIEKAAEILTGQKKPAWGAALDWGLEHEQEAFIHFNNQSEQIWEYYGGQEFKFYSYGVFSGASPDGLSTSHLLEIKCPYEKLHPHGTRILAPAAQRADPGPLGIDDLLFQAQGNGAYGLSGIPSRDQPGCRAASGTRSAGKTNVSQFRRRCYLAVFSVYLNGLLQNVFLLQIAIDQLFKR